MNRTGNGQHSRTDAVSLAYPVATAIANNTALEAVVSGHEEESA
jgi:hypothetical protein